MGKKTKFVMRWAPPAALVTLVGLSGWDMVRIHDITKETTRRAPITDDSALVLPELAELELISNYSEIVSAASKADIVAIWDTSHMDGNIRAAKESLTMVDVLAAAGVTDIFLEYPFDRDDDLQSLRKMDLQSASAACLEKGMGHIWITTAKDLVDFCIMRAAFIIYSDLKGLKVHAADNRDIAKLDNNIEYIFHSINTELYNMFAETKAPAYTPLALLSGDAHAQAMGGIMDDRGTLRVIEGARTLGGRIAVIYGGLHFAKGAHATREQGNPAHYLGNLLESNISSNIAHINLGGCNEHYKAVIDVVPDVNVDLCFRKKDLLAKLYRSGPARLTQR